MSGCHEQQRMLFLFVAQVTCHPFAMGTPLAWALLTWAVGRQMKRQVAAVSNEQSAVSSEQTADC